MMQKKESVSQWIYESLKEKILSLQIPEGQFVTLAEYANLYEVSKTPVRDALNQLEQEGYLVSYPRKGYLVKIITRRDVEETFQIRRIVETQAARIAAENAREEELAQLKICAQQFPLNGEVSIDTYDTINDDFHRQIVAMTHNRRLLEWYESIMDEMVRIRRLDSRTLDYTLEKQEHERMAEAIGNRDGALAEQLLREHIESFFQRLKHSSYL